jgi:hypothetical protein
MRIFVFFEKEVTPEQQEAFNKFVETSAAQGAEVEGLGGGIKNPKP